MQKQEVPLDEKVIRPIITYEAFMWKTNRKENEHLYSKQSAKIV